MLFRSSEDSDLRLSPFDTEEAETRHFRELLYVLLSGAQNNIISNWALTFLGQDNASNLA